MTLLEPTTSAQSGNPPNQVAPGAGLGCGADEATAVKGSGAFPEPAVAFPSELMDSAWDSLLATDGRGVPTDVAELTAALESSRELRSAALLSALERARQALVSTPSSAAIDQTVTLPVVDLIAMTRSLMSRLR